MQVVRKDIQEALQRDLERLKQSKFALRYEERAAIIAILAKLLFAPKILTEKYLHNDKYLFSEFEKEYLWEFFIPINHPEFKEVK